MRVTAPQQGFSLIEAVVACSVLLLTCVVIGGTLRMTFQGERVVTSRAVVDAALAAERAWLVSLPYSEASPPSAGAETGGETPANLLAAVFPPARTELNREGAYYCDESSSMPGAFVTLTQRGGVTVRREARFTAPDGQGSSPLPPSLVAGWSLRDPLPLPASTIDVLVEASSGTRSGSLQLRLHALPAAMAVGTTGWGGGGGAA
jgi:hypothetical protein